MEETEKMVALKKAYADIILNTAKEAAARVIVSERKALRFQQDLRSTKDEALRMLLRLKQMIDAKTTEAEITSLSQRRRIEELDAQLNEAEEMIIDLRAELRKAQDQLEEVKNNETLHSNGPLEKENMLCCENTTHDKKLDISNPFTSSSQFGKFCKPAKQNTTSSSHFDNFFVDDPNLASILMKSKEPELYRNGCSQRIRAIERNLLDGKMHPEDVPDQDFFTKNESVINGNEQNLRTCALSSMEPENTVIKNLDGSGVASISCSAAKDQAVKVRKLPRRRITPGKYKATSCRFRRCQPIKPYQSSFVFPPRKIISHTDNNNVKSGEGVCTQLLTKSEKMNLMENSSEWEGKSLDNNEQGLCILRRSLRKRKVRCWDDFSPLPKSLSNQFTESCQPHSAIPVCKKYSGKDGVGSSKHKLKTTREAEMKKNVGPVSTSRTDKESELIQNDAVEDSELIDKSKHVRATPEAPGVSNCNLNIEADKGLVTDSKVVDAKLSGSTNGAALTDKNRLLKYTFSRKRKKDLSTKSNECPSLGKSSTNNRMGEKPSISPELQKTALINESAMDNQRVVEVACQVGDKFLPCQLISLSGKQRW